MTRLKLHVSLFVLASAVAACGPAGPEESAITDELEADQSPPAPPRPTECPRPRASEEEILRSAVRGLDGNDLAAPLDESPGARTASPELLRFLETLSCGCAAASEKKPWKEHRRLNRPSGWCSNGSTAPGDSP